MLGRVSSSCSTSDTLRINLVTNSVISHEWGKDREVFTTSGTYTPTQQNKTCTLYIWCSGCLAVPPQFIPCFACYGPSFVFSSVLVDNVSSSVLRFTVCDYPHWYLKTFIFKVIFVTWSILTFKIIISISGNSSFTTNQNY